MSEMEGSPRTWPPLGLPTGSVRALLTLGIVGVVVSNQVRGREIDFLWMQVLLVALAQYFAARRIVALPAPVIERLENEGVLGRERQPLFLPRYSIRLILIAAFVGLGIYLYREHRLFDRDVVKVLGVVFAYMAGSFLRGVLGWINRRRSGRPSPFWGDATAVLVLGALIVVALPELVNTPWKTQHELLEIGLGIVLFYFGFR